MKILWLANTPCGSIRRFDKTSIIGGWLVSLEDEIKKHADDIDLYVAYISNRKERPFVYENVHYFPIENNRPSNPIIRVMQKYRSLESADKKFMQRVLKVIGEVEPNIIHIHGTERNWGLIQPFVKNIPIVFSIQGLMAPYLEKFFTGLPQSQVYQLDSMYDRIRKASIKDYFKSFSYCAEREKRYLVDARYIFGRTFWDKNVTLALNPQRKYFVVNEIMRSQFYHRPWSKSKFDPELQLISTISGGIYKGYETILKAALLLKKHSKIDFKWHIAGYDKQSKWVLMAENITGIKSDDVNIVFHGLVNADTLSNLLVASDIYCNVSHIENSPNSVCEAMLVGLPIISTFTGGTASLITNEKEGLLIQDGDPYILSGSIIDLYNHFSLSSLYAGNARRRALSRHDPQRIYAELLDGYNQVSADFKMNH